MTKKQPQLKNLFPLLRMKLSTKLYLFICVFRTSKISRKSLFLKNVFNWILIITALQKIKNTLMLCFMSIYYSCKVEPSVSIYSYTLGGFSFKTKKTIPKDSFYKCLICMVVFL